MLSDRDVVLVTLDSCRYDTAVAANTPNLQRLGPLLKTETSGTYTLPAHTAFFTGNLPKPLSGKYPIGDAELAAIWRSAAARATPGDVGIPFDGRTLMHHYRSRGFRVIGAGGVTFFDPDEPNNWGPPDASVGRVCDLACWVHFGACFDLLGRAVETGLRFSPTGKGRVSDRA